MRKLIYFTMASLDGFIDHPDSSLDWVIVDEELHRFINGLESQAGAYLYGRRMYELMQAAWPPVENDPSAPAFMVEFSKIWKKIPKIVFSSTLERVEGNARLVKEDPVETVKRMKDEPGPDLEVGGAVLASALMRAGLVDEYRIFIQPVALGAGTRMFPPLDEVVKLRLVETKAFGSGVVYVRAVNGF
jgi:dihydrofolate reductase